MDVKVKACGAPCQTEGELQRQRWENQPAASWATRERGAHANTVCTLCQLYGATRESWGCCVLKLDLEKRMQSQPTGFAISHCI